MAAEVSGVLSASSRSITGRSGVALPGRGMLGRSTLADDSPAEWGRSRSRGAIVSLTLSPSLSGFSPTLTMGADLHTCTQVLDPAATQRKTATVTSLAGKERDAAMQTGTHMPWPDMQMCRPWALMSMGRGGQMCWMS